MTYDYEIVSQVPSTEPVASGPPIRGVLVTFRTPSGATNTRFFSQADYTVANVRRVLSDDAAVMEQIAAGTAPE